MAEIKKTKGKVHSFSIKPRELQSVKKEKKKLVSRWVKTKKPLKHNFRSTIKSDGLQKTACIFRWQKKELWEKAGSLKQINPNESKIAAKDTIEKTLSSKEGSENSKLNLMLLDYIEARGTNFFVATSNINHKLGKNLTVEETKKIYFKIRPELLVKSEFDFEQEKKRKKELNAYHSRTAEVEKEILRLLSLKKSISDEIKRRKKRKSKSLEKTPDLKDIKEIKTTTTMKLPTDVDTKLSFNSDNEEVYLISSKIKQKFKELDVTQTQNMKEYLHSMLNYEQEEPIKVSSLCCVKLWNELRRNIGLLLRLQELCRQKKEIIDRIEASLLSGHSQK